MDDASSGRVARRLLTQPGCAEGASYLRPGEVDRARALVGTNNLSRRGTEAEEDPMEDFEQEQSGEEQLDEIEEEIADLETTADELGEDDDDALDLAEEADSEGESGF